MKNPTSQQQLNPNWEELRQKLKNYGPKKQSTNGGQKVDGEAHKAILGKRKERESQDEGNVVRPDPLLPTSSDCSLTDVIAMDCEMVGVSSMGNKSALGRVTLVNKWRNVVYDEYVRPTEYVVDFRTQVSGIRPRDLKKAKDFGVVQKEVAELLKGKILVGHALRNDLKALLLSHPKQDIRDTAEYQYFHKSGEARHPALRRLALDYLGVEIQNGEHCPIQDARAAMVLYEKSRKQWEKSVKDSIRLKGKQKKRKRGKKIKDNNNNNNNNNNNSDVNAV